MPHSDEMMVLGSSGIFVLRYPDHPVTGILKQAAALLLQVIACTAHKLWADCVMDSSRMRL